MIVDGEGYDLVNAIETLLEEAPARGDQARADGVGARDLDRPVHEHGGGRARSCARCARRCRPARPSAGLTIGSAGTHPFAMWEDQRIVGRDRYRDLISALRFVARQELHLRPARPRRRRRPGQGDPRRQRDARPHAGAARAVGQLAVLARRRRRACTRRARRSSAPSRASASRPRYGDWEDYAEQIDFMVDSGVIEDYTYLWYDVRPHPHFGTVEIRVCDAQTRVEHTLGARGADPGDGARSCASTSRRARRCRDYPWQMLDENKWLAARHGLDGELVDLPGASRVRDARPGAPAARPPARARRGPGLGGRARRRSTTCWSAATGRSASSSVYEANHDLREVDGARSSRRPRDGARAT